MRSTPSPAALVRADGSVVAWFGATGAWPAANVIGLLGVLIAYGFVRLSAAFSHAGSVYAFSGATLGPQAGFFAGWALLILVVLSGIAHAFKRNDRWVAAGIFASDERQARDAQLLMACLAQLERGALDGDGRVHAEAGHRHEELRRGV